MKFPAFEPIDIKNNVDAFSVAEIHLSKVNPDPNQPRKNFDVAALEELAASIKKHGVIQPIIVKQVDMEYYQIIAGERRWRASQIAGLTAIPSIIHTNSEVLENVAISLIENIQREELNPIELAESFYKLNTSHKLSHEEIASMVGKSRATVTNSLRLLNLPKEVRDLLIEGLLEMGHARALLTLPLEQQTVLAQKIVNKKLTVREAERLARVNKEPKEEKVAPYASEIDDWIQKLSQSLPSKVNININQKGEGKVIIHFTSPDEVDWLVDTLDNKNSKE